MPTQEASLECNSCGRRVKARRQVANDSLHAILIAFTVGLWLPFYLFARITPTPWQCSRCGSGIGEHRPPPFWLVALLAFSGIAALLFGFSLLSWLTRSGSQP